MNRSLPARLLLLLLFFVGQSLALAHATQHELVPGDSPTCATCALAHAGGAAPTAPAWACTPLPVLVEAATAHPVDPCVRRTRRLRNRAPPFSLS